MLTQLCNPGRPPAVVGPRVGSMSPGRVEAKNEVLRRMKRDAAKVEKVREIAAKLLKSLVRVNLCGAAASPEGASPMTAGR